MLGSLVIDNGPHPTPPPHLFGRMPTAGALRWKSQGARDNMTSLTVIDPTRLRLPSVRPSHVVYDMMPICSSAAAAALVFLFII
jgi:hypothetical protein